VSASTFMYLMRWPVFLLIWLKLIFSESEVAGYKATGQVTRERRKKPFQLARGAIEILQNAYRTRIQDDLAALVPTINGGIPQMGVLPGAHTNPSGLSMRSLFVLNSAHEGAHMNIGYIRSEIEHMRRQILRQRKEIQDLQRAGIPTKSAVRNDLKALRVSAVTSGTVGSHPVGTKSGFGHLSRLHHCVAASWSVWT
jgi:hypothetical protein